MAVAACLYLLISAFLILCLIHPHDGHSHSQSDQQIHVTCVWVQKAVSSHAPSAPVIFPVVEAVPFTLLSIAFLIPQTRLIHVTGRSPPSLPVFA